MVGVAVPLWYTGSGGLISYAFASSLPTIVATGGLALYLFGTRHPDLRPIPGQFDRETLRTLWGYAGPLAIYQLANLMVLFSANLIIANRLGPAFVTAYSVPYAAFAALINVAWLLASPYMPAIAEAQSRQDWAWLRRRVLHVVGVSAGIVAVGGSFLLVAGQPLIGWWTAGIVTPSLSFLTALFSLRCSAQQATRGM